MHPHLNNYVSNQFLSNGIGSSWRNSPLSGQGSYDLGATMAYPPEPDSDGLEPTMAYQPHKSSAGSMNDILNDPYVKERLQYDYGKKPVVLTISPMNIDQDDLSKMKMIDFGNKSLSGVRDDANRHQMQRKLAAERGDQNEPIILAEKGNNTYKVMEGFHRLIAYFYQSAPPEIRQALDSGQVDWKSVDFSKWPAVNVRAYVGKPLVQA